MQIIPIPYFDDNYSYAILYKRNNCYLFDAGDGRAIADFLECQKLNPTMLFITHNHHDHCDGVEELKKRFPQLTVILPNCAKEENFTTDVLPVKPIFTPGHTEDHVCYYLPSVNTLITGDTVFAGGIGRCFTGNFPLYFNSLHKLTTLPGETKLYGAHEYLSSNRDFIQSLGEETSFYNKRLENEKYPSAGIELAQELLHNPLLRICQTQDIEEFTKLRMLKDHF